MRILGISIVPALALLALAGPASAAAIGSVAADAVQQSTDVVLVQQRGRGGPPGGPPGNFARRGDGGGGFRGTRYLWGPGVAFYYYDGYYHGDCGWLRRKARETGSAYWYRRYRQCRDD